MNRQTIALALEDIADTELILRKLSVSECVLEFKSSQPYEEPGTTHVCQTQLVFAYFISDGGRRKLHSEFGSIRRIDR